MVYLFRLFFITLLLGTIRAISYEVNNKFLDSIAKFANSLDDRVIFMVIDILLGVLTPVVYYYIITIVKGTYTSKVITLTYNVKKFNVLSEDLQGLGTKQVAEYMEPIWNNYYLGFSIGMYIVLGFIGIVLVGSLNTAIVNKDKKRFRHYSGNDAVK